jgi:hypothetical protein
MEKVVQKTSPLKLVRPTIPALSKSGTQICIVIIESNSVSLTVRATPLNPREIDPDNNSKKFESNPIMYCVKNDQNAILYLGHLRPLR